MMIFKMRLKKKKNNESNINKFILWIHCTENLSLKFNLICNNLKKHIQKGIYSNNFYETIQESAISLKDRLYRLKIQFWNFNGGGSF